MNMAELDLSDQAGALAKATTAQTVPRATPPAFQKGLGPKVCFVEVFPSATWLLQMAQMYGGAGM